MQSDDDRNSRFILRTLHTSTENIFKIKEEKQPCQYNILYPENISSINKGEIKIFSNIQKLKQFITGDLYHKKYDRDPLKEVMPGGGLRSANYRKHCNWQELDTYKVHFLTFCLLERKLMC